MWLLNTKTLMLKAFPNASRIRYAILSHVWRPDDEEYNFQSIRATYEEFRDLEGGALAHSPDKVRRFCMLAAEEGYDWVWLDTSCIDKTSSAELSEAINLMYAWYGAAEVCYAYLYDVCDGDTPLEPNSQFSKSEWHERGWTLQELLAPKCMVFLSASWRRLGTKESLITSLAQRSCIDRDILLRVKRITKASVAQRMSWAAHRKTTRDEDRAYSLMGIFGVSMPIIYGEGGERAFLRLQKEVVSTCPDQTVFAWGPMHPNFDIVRDAIQRNLTSGVSIVPSERSGCRLLATSPADFEGSADVRPFDPHWYMMLFGHAIDYKCTFSAGGITVRLPTLPDFVSAGQGVAKQAVHAVALASAPSSGEHSIIFLFLTRSYNLLDRCDDFPQELSAGPVGLGLLDDDGRRHFYRGAALRLPNLILNNPLRSEPITDNLLSSLRSDLAYLARRELLIEFDEPDRDIHSMMQFVSQYQYLRNLNSVSVFADDGSSARY